MNFDFSSSLVNHPNIKFISQGDKNHETFWSDLLLVDGLICLISPLFKEQITGATIFRSESFQTPIKIQDQPIIYLNAKCGYWCQIAFQLAHEYLHLVVSSPVRCKPLLWFEESLASLMSITALERLYKFWDTLDIGHFSPSYKQAVRFYLDNLLSDQKDFKINLSLLNDQNSDLFKLGNDDPYFGDVDHRSTNRSIALAMEPVFGEYPFLWECMQTIKNVSDYSGICNSLKELDHLTNGVYMTPLSKLSGLFSSETKPGIPLHE